MVPAGASPLSPQPRDRSSSTEPHSVLTSSEEFQRCLDVQEPENLAGSTSLQPWEPQASSNCVLHLRLCFPTPGVVSQRCHMAYLPSNSVGYLQSTSHTLPPRTASALWWSRCGTPLPLHVITIHQHFLRHAKGNEFILLIRASRP